MKIEDSKIAELLLNGGVGILPTDTVYGLVCVAANEEAVGKLYALKKREQKPGTVIAASTQQLVELGIKARYLKPVEYLWPNPISVVIPNYELKHIHLGKGGIAVRITANNKLAQLIKRTGPLLTTSANPPSQTPAHTIKEAEKYFGSKVDFYVDGGDLSGHQPSTLIRILDDAVEILREGAVKVNEKGEIV